MAYKQVIIQERYKVGARTRELLEKQVSLRDHYTELAKEWSSRSGIAETELALLLRLRATAHCLSCGIRTAADEYLWFCEHCGSKMCRFHRRTGSAVTADNLARQRKIKARARWRRLWPLFDQFLTQGYWPESAERLAVKKAGPLNNYKFVNCKEEVLQANAAEGARRRVLEFMNEPDETPDAIVLPSYAPLTFLPKTPIVRTPPRAKVRAAACSETPAAAGADQSQ